MNDFLCSRPNDYLYIIFKLLKLNSFLCNDLTRVANRLLPSLHYSIEKVNSIPDYLAAEV